MSAEPDAGDVETRDKFCVCPVGAPWGVSEGDTHTLQCSTLWQRLAAHDAEVRRATAEQIAEDLDHAGFGYAALRVRARIAREASA